MTKKRELKKKRTAKHIARMIEGKPKVMHLYIKTKALNRMGK